MSPEVDARSVLERLSAFDPEQDHSEPLKFTSLSSTFPFYSGPEEGLTAVNVSSFAELAYCPYKVWHSIHGTPVIRPPRGIRAVTRGTALHANRETKLLEEVAKAKPATKRQLQNPDIDLVELPEFPGRFKRETWLYRARLDGLSREGGDLVVHEFKTGRYSQMPDHLLQVWAYCLASPGAMTRATNGDLRARGLSWEVVYPALGEVWGPFQFRRAQAELLGDALVLFENTGAASLEEGPLDLGWQPVPSKCAPCGYSHACPWKAT